MPNQEVTLGVAAFLDSESLGKLAPGVRATARPLLTAFLTACVEGLGKRPNELDGQELSELLVQHLPRYVPRDPGPRDPVAEHVPELLWAYLDHLEETTLVSHVFELRRALEESAPRFLERVRAGSATPAAAPKTDPFVHGASKLGRNDPCSCGSGKKFKKCHGKNA